MSAFPATQRLENRVQLARIVLSVAVDLHGDVEAVGERVAVAGLNGAPDAEVERKAKKPGAGGLGDFPGPVVGSVVDYQDLEAGVDASNLLDHPPDASLPR